MHEDYVPKCWLWLGFFHVRVFFGCSVITCAGLNVNEENCFILADDARMGSAFLLEPLFDRKLGIFVQVFSCALDPEDVVFAVQDVLEDASGGWVGLVLNSIFRP